MRKLLFLIPLILSTFCTNPSEPEEKKPELIGIIDSYWVNDLYDYVSINYTIYNIGDATAKVYEWDIYVETDKGNKVSGKYRKYNLKEEEEIECRSDIDIVGVTQCTKVEIRNLKCTKY